VFAVFGCESAGGLSYVHFVACSAVSSYIPLSSEFFVEWWGLCFVVWSVVLVLLNAVLVFVCW
jgi:hypothetical protein